MTLTTPVLFWAGRGFFTGAYYEVAAIIVTLILMGRLLEARARAKTGGAIRALIGLQPKTARVERGGVELDLPVGELLVGDLVLVRPGEKVLYPVTGWLLSPIIASLAMALSSVSVVSNALRLRGFRA